MSYLKMFKGEKLVYSDVDELTVDVSEKDTEGNVISSETRETKLIPREEPFIDPEFRKDWEKKK